jgi:3-hydroxyacyl-[acyl-carrier-protein] dehydratase
MTKHTLPIDINDITKLIPHRYPILLVDRIIGFTEESIIGLKNVTMNEPHFNGHFPSKPIMPGVLIIEALAQTAAIYVVKTLGLTDASEKLVYFMSIESAKFRKLVTPGDSLHLHVTKDRNRGNVWRFTGEAKVDGQIAAEAIFTAMIVDK